MRGTINWAMYLLLTYKLIFPLTQTQCYREKVYQSI